MAWSWTSVGRQFGSLALRQVQQSGVLPNALRALASTVTDTRPRPTRPVVPVRPVTPAGTPTSTRARRVVYSPDLDGRADPGEIVWTWVVFEDDPNRGKDRPVLVVGREDDTLLGLMLSSNPARESSPQWLGIGSGSWDQQQRPSWIRLDRVLEVPEAGIRREGAILPRSVFDRIAHRLCAEYGWR